ncbi:hypothetical protein [Paraburkholderia sp. SIMBA_054]|uniref:hypothetical protein n=1 Tax=Paraburkholderia sp. SIMBA_054 TaxID=3085795 RepID=UPI00397827BF
MITINTRGPADHGYIGGLNHQKVEVYARSLMEAKQRVTEYFKPKKKDQHQIWVQLCELNKEVTFVEQPVAVD